MENKLFSNKANKIFYKNNNNNLKLNNHLLNHSKNFERIKALLELDLHS